MGVPGVSIPDVIVLPLPPPPHAVSRVATHARRIAAPIQAWACLDRRPVTMPPAASRSRSKKASKEIDPCGKCGHGPRRTPGGSEECVIMLTWNETGEVPTTVNVAGVTTHFPSCSVRSWELLLQASVTEPVNPPIGLSCRLYVAVWPAVTAAVVVPIPPNEKSVPMPDSAIVCGLCGLVALSVTIRVPVHVPDALGAKPTSMVQVAPADMLPPQLSYSVKSELPLIASWEMISGALPALLNVSACEATTPTD